MVNELIFRAADTATALEKVQTKLGEDAFIIGIKNVGSFVEITASIEPPKKRPVKNSRDAERWFHRCVPKRVPGCGGVPGIHASKRQQDRSGLLQRCWAHEHLDARGIDVAIRVSV